MWYVSKNKISKSYCGHIVENVNNCQLRWIPVGSESENLMEMLQDYGEQIAGCSNAVMPFVDTSDLPTNSGAQRPRTNEDHVNTEEEINEQHDLTTPNVVFRTLEENEEPSEDRLANWLKKAENGKLKDFIMTTPPIRPKGGEIFLYRCKNLLDEDYRRDGYTGMASSYNNYRFKSKLDRITCQLRDKKKKIIPGFKKQIVSLRKHSGRPNKMKLLWYSGETVG